MACKCLAVHGFVAFAFYHGKSQLPESPPLSAVTVEYMQVLLHTYQSGAWQLMKWAGHEETGKHLFHVHCSEDGVGYL